MVQKIQYFLSQILVYGHTYFQGGCFFFSAVLYPDKKTMAIEKEENLY